MSIWRPYSFLKHTDLSCCLLLQFSRHCCCRHVGSVLFSLVLQQLCSDPDIQPSSSVLLELLWITVNNALLMLSSFIDWHLLYLGICSNGSSANSFQMFCHEALLRNTLHKTASFTVLKVHYVRLFPLKSPKTTRRVIHEFSPIQEFSRGALWDSVASTGCALQNLSSCSRSSGYFSHAVFQIL